MPKRRPDIPKETLKRLRAICSRLPEVREESAWTGTRWRIRKKTFAHVLMIANAWPPAYAQAAATEGSVCVLTFRSTLAAFEPAAFTDRPFFRPRWFPDIAGIFLDRQTDWDEIAALLTASYIALAPKKLTQSIAP